MNAQRLEAAITMLIDSGDLTPMGARLLRSANINDQDQQRVEQSMDRLEEGVTRLKEHFDEQYPLRGRHLDT